MSASTSPTMMGLFAQRPPSANTCSTPWSLLGSWIAANDRKIGAALDAMPPAPAPSSRAPSRWAVRWAKSPSCTVFLNTQERWLLIKTAGMESEMPRISNTSSIVVSPSASDSAPRKAASPLDVIRPDEHPVYAERVPLILVAVEERRGVDAAHSAAVQTQHPVRLDGTRVGHPASPSSRRRQLPVPIWRFLLSAAALNLVRGAAGNCSGSFATKLANLCLRVDS